MVLGMHSHIHTILCYDLYFCYQICVFERYLMVIKKSVCVCIFGEEGKIEDYHSIWDIDKGGGTSEVK